MKQQEIDALYQSQQLLNRCAHLKPSANYARDGVRGGIVIAFAADGSLLLAIHGRLDDRLWVSPAKIARISADASWQIEGRYLNETSAKELDADMSNKPGQWVLTSGAALSELTRFGL
jgi:hypothetical protein